MPMRFKPSEHQNICKPNHLQLSEFTKQRDCHLGGITFILCSVIHVRSYCYKLKADHKKIEFSIHWVSSGFPSKHTDYKRNGMEVNYEHWSELTESGETRSRSSTRESKSKTFLLLNHMNQWGIKKGRKWMNPVPNFRVIQRKDLGFRTI